MNNPFVIPPPRNAIPRAVPSTYFFEHDTTDLEAKYSQYAITNNEEEELVPTRKLSAYVADGLRSWLPVTQDPQYHLAHIQDVAVHPPPLTLDLTASRAAPISAHTLKAHINSLPEGEYEPRIVDGSMYFIPLDSEDVKTARDDGNRMTQSPFQFTSAEKDKCSTAEEIVTGQINLSMTDLQRQFATL
ncbi:hypothetical protein PRIPAC_77100 [Pristionchus pacificus]|uniref:Uncharacterized protein n=1 Tax=Pristionchus pacificus TaxID=54126 RepID=A0A2A6BXT8_PRIPA|nr:hypothetical protein PRIPAC_77100 [Pristionchus pacificus]|eukprot:PDM70720.1 hypothetical protein PRIPAC_44924 [Pristionchus pacificus]